MWALLRWLSAKPPRLTHADAPATTASRAGTLTTDPPNVPPEDLGLQRIESRGHPDRYYYRNPIPPPLPDYPCIKGDGLFTYHIFGASLYQQQLERIAGGRREVAVYFRVNAVLSSEPENPYDKNAIQILVNGEKVGYVRREDNVSLRAQLNAVGITGDVQCRAEIAGGWNRGGRDLGDFGLRLDITFPLEVRPPRKGKPKPT
jgi:hypothetical protein